VAGKNRQLGKTRTTRFRRPRRV
jgi:hypothetical protein